MQITIDVDEATIRAVAQKAVASVFSAGDRWESAGAGVVAIRKQANAWAEAQDYTAIIADVAGSAMREAVRSAVLDSIRAEVKRTVKTMREAGEIATLFEVVQS